MFYIDDRSVGRVAETVFNRGTILHIAASSFKESWIKEIVSFGEKYQCCQVWYVACVVR
jgi:hypothetical protein